MTTNNLLQCPKCLETGKTQYLGRILDSGELLVLRFHHGTTIIRSSEYEIVCGCGYRFLVRDGGTVSVNQLS